MDGLPSLSDIQAERCRRSLALFVQRAWHVLEPSTPLEWNWHLEAVCQHIQAALEDWMRRQVDPAYQQRIKKLLVCIPPGSAKSRLTSVMAPAWMWTRWPGWRSIFLSANPRVALRDSVLCRDLIESSWYRDTFKPAWTLKDDQDAKSLFYTTAGGFRMAIGFQARVTGDRADCVAGETLVATEHGEIPIAKLVAMRSPPRVWSLNHQTGNLELRRILAARVIRNRQTVTVRTVSGELVECTHDHRIFAGGRYEKAEGVTGLPVSVLRWPHKLPAGPGHQVSGVLATDADLLLRQGVSDGCGRGGQVPPAASEASLLLGAVCLPGDVGRGARDQRGAPGAAGVCLPGVRGEVQGRGPGLEAETAHVLLAQLRLHGDAARPADLPRAALRHLPDAHAPKVAAQGLLRPGMREPGPLPTDASGRQLQLAGGQGEVPAPVPAAATVHPGAGREPLCRVWVYEARDRRDCGPSHRRQPQEQRAGEPDHALPAVPLPAPHLEAVPVSVVERGGGAPVDVYDLQVEGTHNFFAGGILVHNCLVVDDPHDADEVNSKAQREAVLERWDNAICNRVNDARTSVRIGIMQRLHEADWAGHVQSREGDWELLSLPMEYEPEQARVTAIGWRDPRTEPGQLLFPARFTPEVVAAEKRRGSYRYAAQYQQRPVPLAGGLFKREWWKRYGTPPATFDEIIQSWDCTFTGGEDSDFVVGQVWGRVGANKYLLDQVRARLSFTDTCRVMQDLSRKWPQATAKLVENKANGPAILSTLQDRLEGLIAVEPEGSKEARAVAVSPQVESGNVWLPEDAPWVSDFLEEVSTFPKCAHDDQVDAMSQALRRLGTGGGGWLV